MLCAISENEKDAPSGFNNALLEKLALAKQNQSALAKHLAAIKAARDHKT